MKIALYISILLICFSCKKDKLEDDKEVFIGTWNWVYTRHKTDVCQGGPQITEIFTPESDDNNYSMRFIEKGMVEFNENDMLIQKDRVVFVSFGSASVYGEEFVSFDIHLNNKTSDVNSFIGHISLDTLIVRMGFPYGVYDSGCERCASYFARK